MLETYIRERLKERDILLMTHIVIGYPDFETSYRIVRRMVEAGVELMELQIPFSEPMADGPVILKANQEALKNGVTVDGCFEFARKAARDFNIPFLMMTYANIPFKYGFESFAGRMADIGLKGAIVPDLPPEEGGEYHRAMLNHHLSPIYIFSPRTSDERLAYLSGFCSGFVYCLARKGVTGKQTHFSTELAAYLKRCRKAVKLPLAVGFGVKDKHDVAYLKGKADIAVIGSRTIQEIEENGVEAVAPFIGSLSA